MFVAATLPLLLLTAQADTVARKPAEVRFTGDIGYVATSGNSSVETLNVGDKFSAKLGDVTLSQAFTLVYGESKGETVTSIYRGSLRIDKGLRTECCFSAYTLLNYERNTFAGLASRVSGVTGLAAQLLNGGRHKLVVEGGLSLTRQRGTGVRGRDVDFLGGRAASTYTHQFGPKASVAASRERRHNIR